jgi:predicted nucleotidyltransferase
MILFGSRARDDWLYTSDVDLILVSENFQSMNFLQRMRWG